MQLKTVEEITSRRDWYISTGRKSRLGFSSRGKEAGSSSSSSRCFFPACSREGSQLGTEERQECLVCTAHPCAKQSWSWRLALCEPGGSKKAISCHCHGNARLRQERAGPIRQEPSSPRTDSAGAPEPFPAARQRCDPDSQPGGSTPEAVFLIPRGFLGRFPSGDET